MAHTGALYDDPGADYYTRRDPERLKRHALTNSNDSATTSPSPQSPQQPKEGSVPQGESSRQSQSQHGKGFS